MDIFEIFVHYDSKVSELGTCDDDHGDNEDVHSVAGDSEKVNTVDNGRAWDGVNEDELGLGDGSDEIPVAGGDNEDVHSVAGDSEKVNTVDNGRAWDGVNEDELGLGDGSDEIPVAGVDEATLNCLKGTILTLMMSLIVTQKLKMWILK
ncbi:hypothetical protein Dsin_009553 [Dipteronia sinensis]|uniref:Uncharacterized protein n=1 Tax=Dipteronia sinensis TaxID=43782 RepID=A0AAE0AR58_9ROSI|nr:hypothetical protein Dsin_009553 [Dipteronia sinensis]